MKKIISVILLVCLLSSSVEACAEGLFGSLGGLMSALTGESENEFEGKDLKTKLKALETFFDEYCTFMETYDENTCDLALLSEYTELMLRYADAMQALESIDEDTLTDSEQKLYTETLLRISARLAAAGIVLSL